MKSIQLVAKLDIQLSCMTRYYPNHIFKDDVFSKDEEKIRKIVDSYYKYNRLAILWTSFNNYQSSVMVGCNELGIESYFTELATLSAAMILFFKQAKTACNTNEQLKIWMSHRTFEAPELFLLGLEECQMIVAREKGTFPEDIETLRVNFLREFGKQTKKLKANNW